MRHYHQDQKENKPSIPKTTSNFELTVAKDTFLNARGYDDATMPSNEVHVLQTNIPLQPNEHQWNVPPLPPIEFHQQELPNQHQLRRLPSPPKKHHQNVPPPPPLRGIPYQQQQRELSSEYRNLPQVPKHYKRRAQN